MPSSQIERKLAAIMFTDIAGYTALSAKDENKALELLDTQKQILTPIIEECNGTLHKEVGDGLLFTFQTVTEAVKCGIKIQEETKSNDDLNLRIGIHEGEITLKDGDALGDDVNVASRIEAFSPSGGIAISSKVQQNISSLPEFETSYVGKPELKGVAQKVEVYCITSHGLPKADEIDEPVIVESKSNFNIFAITGGILTAIGIAFWIAVGVFDVSFGGKTEVPSIAIIPFDNKGADEDEFYAYGISSELISDITGSGLIRVAGLKDIEKLEYQTLNYNELSKKLFVRYIAQGTLWKVDSMFQLSMELYDAKTSKVLWSKNWQKEWNELTSIKGNLAENILKILKVSTKQDIALAPTSNTEAYKYFLEAKYKHDKRENMEDIEIARSLLKKAIELDKNLSIAKNLMGITYLSTSDYNEAMEIFAENLKKAEDIGDMVSIGRSLINIGIINLNKTGEYQFALDNYTHALEIFEEIGDKYRMGIALSNIGGIYSRKNDYKLALDYYTRTLDIAEELDDKRLIAYTLLDIGGIYQYKDIDYEKALEHYARTLNILEDIGDKHGFGKSLMAIGNVHYQKGNLVKALGYYNRSLNLYEELGNKGWILYLLNDIGNTYSAMSDYDKALVYFSRSLKLGEELGDKRGTGNSLYDIGELYWYKGDLDKSIYYYNLSLKIYELLDNKRHIVIALNSIGWNYYEMGDYDQALGYYKLQINILKELGLDHSNEMNNLGLVYYQQQDYNKALEFLENSATMQMGVYSKMTLETASHLLLSKKILGKEYDEKTIHKLIKEEEEIYYDINYTLFRLLVDTSYLKTAYNQVQEKADNLEPDVAAKFLSYPIPKAIVEEWEKVK